MNISEKNLIYLHLTFIIFAYWWTISATYSLGFLLIGFYKMHEDLIGDCYLTKVQKDKGYSGPNDDFFYYLLNKKIGFDLPRKMTSSIHWLIKISILVIVVTKGVIQAVQ